MTVAEVNGIRTHYRIIDADADTRVDETVVFVHGLGTDSLASFYLTLAPPLAAAGLDVVTYDLRGHGRTEQPSTGYTLGHFVDDLHELLAHLGVGDRGRPVHLVGNSFGGTIAFSYALRHPDRVASLVSIEAEPATEAWSARMAEVLGNTIDFLLDPASLAWLEREYGTHRRRLAASAATRITSTTMVEEIPVGPLFAAADVAAFPVPVLSLLGVDGYQSRDLNGLTSRLPDARLVVFPDQGHSVLVERHREVRELVLDWVRGHPAADRREAAQWPAS